MKKIKLFPVITLLASTSFFVSCSSDDNQILKSEQKLENKSFFHDLFKAQQSSNDNNYSIRAITDYVGTYTGTYVINSMLAGSGPGSYQDVLNKWIKIEVNETTQKINLEIESFKVGKMPANINIKMKDIAYTENGNTVSFQGTDNSGFSVLFVETPITVQGTIVKDGTNYTMTLNFQSDGEYGPMVINANVDFTGVK